MQRIFVGRQSELGILEGKLGEARLGQGSLTLVSGEAGVGKTRVVPGNRHHTV